LSPPLTVLVSPQPSDSAPPLQTAQDGAISNSGISSLFAFQSMALRCAQRQLKETYLIHFRNKHRYVLEYLKFLCSTAAADVIRHAQDLTSASFLSQSLYFASLRDWHASSSVLCQMRRLLYASEIGGGTEVRAARTQAHSAYTKLAR